MQDDKKNQQPIPNSSQPNEDKNKIEKINSNDFIYGKNANWGKIG